MNVWALNTKPRFIMDDLHKSKNIQYLVRRIQAASATV